MHLESGDEAGPTNIIPVLMWALEQPHAITERNGELFITAEPFGTITSLGAAFITSDPIVERSANLSASMMVEGAGRPHD
jgi:hypothetical protein